MFEDAFAPPFYTDLYNFKDGAQDDIFLDSYAEIPPPSPDSTAVPTPIHHSTGASSGITSSSPNAASSSVDASPGSCPNTDDSRTGNSKTWYALSFPLKEWSRLTHCTAISGSGMRDSLAVHHLLPYSLELLVALVDKISANGIRFDQGPCSHL